MPNWNKILEEVNSTDNPIDKVRKNYLSKLFSLTNRNIIVYYSGWLQKQNVINFSGINDSDKTGFMSAIYKMNKSLELDLILHTPGGDIAAVESLVEYLRAVFGHNIRAIVPQLALSGGTMIACACKEILMGKHSSLGPIDPQFFGIPAHGIKEEFEQAIEDIKKHPDALPLWQIIISKYSPTLLGECEKAIKWSNEMVGEWLKTGMFYNDCSIQTSEIEKKIKIILEELGDHALTKSHSRHLSINKCQSIGLKIIPLEENNDLQDLILTLHHLYIHTLSETDAIKIIENQEGTAFIQYIKS